MSNPTIGQPVQYQSTKGCLAPAFAPHAALVKSVEEDGTTVSLHVFGPFGAYDIGSSPAGTPGAPAAGTWNPLP